MKKRNEKKNCRWFYCCIFQFSSIENFGHGRFQRCVYLSYVVEISSKKKPNEKLLYIYDKVLAKWVNNKEKFVQETLKLRIHFRFWRNHGFMDFSFWMILLCCVFSCSYRTFWLGFQSDFEFVPFWNTQLFVVFFLFHSFVHSVLRSTM